MAEEYPAPESFDPGKRYSNRARVDLGGLERHEGGIIYPRWARTVKNASLYTAEGIKCWWGDIGKHQVRTHLRGRGTFYVLTEHDSFWNHCRPDRPADGVALGGAPYVDTHAPGLDFVRARAIAVVENGRWIWQDLDLGAFRDKQERNGKRQWRRQGRAPLTCGCEVTKTSLRQGLTSLHSLLERRGQGRNALPAPPAHRLSEVAEFARTALGAADPSFLPEIHALVEGVRRCAEDPREYDYGTVESMLGVLESRLHAAGLLTDCHLVDRRITVIEF